MLMRRLLLLVTVGLVMAAMLLAMAIPAFAAPPVGTPPGTPGHPTCTIAEPHSPAIEPAPTPANPAGSCRVEPTFGTLPGAPPQP
jgi:hypothetical protein